MEAFPVLLALCAGNSPFTVNSPHKGSVIRTLIFLWFLFAWWQQAITGINGISHQRDSVAFSIHLRAISQQIPKLLFSTMSLKIILLKILPHFPGANEWKYIPHRSVLVPIPNYNKAQPCVNCVYIHVRHDHGRVVYVPWWYSISNDSRGYCRVLNMAWNSVCYWQKYESVSYVGQCQHICVQVFVLSCCWHRWTCIFLVHCHNISQKIFFFCCFYINLLNKIMQWQSDACRTPESFQSHRKLSISSVTIPQVVITTTCSANSDNKNYDDVTKLKHFPRNWPFVQGIHQSPVNSPHKGQWHGALMFSLICVWINDWVVFFDLRMNKWLSKQSWGWWFETLLHPLWRHCNAASWQLLVFSAKQSTAT